MELRRPASDTPAWATVSGVAAFCFALGLALAYWGTGEPAEVDTTPAGSSSERPTPRADASTPAATDAGASLPDPAQPGAQPTDFNGDAGVAVENTAEETEEVSASDPAEAEPTAPASTPTRFVRGRVAYLRCDGASSGGRCPRDEPLEGAVWAILARLPECPVPAAGEGDLRIAWEGDTPADVLWRDTFADDVVRLDRDAVMGCVEAALMSTRPSSAAGRVLVSFRFRME